MLETLRRIARAFVLGVILLLAFFSWAAASAGPGCNTISKAYVTSMKSDLRNLVSVQEAYRDEHGGFASNEILQSGAMAAVYRQSTFVHVTIEYAGVQGWRARATHERLAKTSCTIDSNTGEPLCVDPKVKPRYFDEKRLWSMSTEFWLFAFTITRRRRRVIATASREREPAI